MAKKPKTKDAAEAAAPLEEDDVSEVTIQVAVKTLTGDIRDFILDRLRHEQDKRPWHLRSEAEQRDTVHKVESAVHEIVTKGVEIIAAGGRRTIRATLDQVTVKDGIVGKIVMMKSDPLRHQLADSVGSQILIVVADPDEFTGERAPAKITPDQGDLEERVGVVHSLSDSAETANDKPFTH